jgi:hypothetical protein
MGTNRPSGPPGEETDIEPAQPGSRNVGAGASTSEVGAAPNAGQADPGASEGTRSDPHVPGGDATGASGGYGTGSGAGSSGSGDAETEAGGDPQTDWLREAPG